jgi:hypothetical protein
MFGHADDAAFSQAHNAAFDYAANNHATLGDAFTPDSGARAAGSGEGGRRKLSRGDPFLHSKASYNIFAGNQGATENHYEVRIEFAP